MTESRGKIGPIKEDRVRMANKSCQSDQSQGSRSAFKVLICQSSASVVLVLYFKRFGITAAHKNVGTSP